MATLTRQEMFNRAYLGLKSQGFLRSMSALVDEFEGGHKTQCVYDNGQGNRCAWGWVDTKIPVEHNFVSLVELHLNGIGLAADLSENDVQFARQLQNCHDWGSTPRLMQKHLHNHAAKFGLTVPND